MYSTMSMFVDQYNIESMIGNIEYNESDRCRYTP